MLPVALLAREMSADAASEAVVRENGDADEKREEDGSVATCVSALQDEDLTNEEAASKNPNGSAERNNDRSDGERTNDEEVLVDSDCDDDDDTDDDQDVTSRDQVRREEERDAKASSANVAHLNDDSTGEILCTVVKFLKGKQFVFYRDPTPQR
uniref:Uncharacterized protein n=1 Tax=Odontella aurita TaxID=265563 RepID=A0A6U6HI94_9STRA|mmetsp:Transcript_48127/g.145361  ORF Transcript_48127/g.145361 Transcript_48127/m.145361 type:complete len:154 (+) Transcript_48127:90-551(+)